MQKTGPVPAPAPTPTPTPASVYNLKLFENKSKHNTHKPRVTTYINNYVAKPKHYPPAVKEWFNSIYAYNKNTIKSLPSLYKMAFKLIKSYFNLYSIKLEKNKIRSRRPRLISKRRSTNRMLTSKPELKYKSDEVTFNTYIYNRQNKNYISKGKMLATIDNIDIMLPFLVQEMINDKNILKHKDWPSNLLMKRVKNRSTYIKQKIKKQADVIFNVSDSIMGIHLDKNTKSKPQVLPNKLLGQISNEELNSKQITEKITNEISKANNSKNVIYNNSIYNSLYKTYIKNNLTENKLYYLKHYVIRCFRKERLSIRIKQLIAFNNYKYQEIYLQPFSVIVKKIFNKKVNFNFVNLKYVYLNSHILTDSITTKLRNKKNRLLSVLKKSLLLFKLPPMDRLTVYNEMYNKQKVLENIKIKSWEDNYKHVNENINVLDSDPLLSDTNITENYREDNVKVVCDNINVLDPLLLDTDKVEGYREAAKMSKIFTVYDLNNEKKASSDSNYLTNAMFLTIKNKNTTGVRLEAEGRLTRRNTAARAVSKLRYKGNIRNMDSSFKGLSCVLLKGYEKSNLQYSNQVSKLRIGSYSIKGWVSSG